MPWATKIYKRDLDVTRYNVPFLLHPSSRSTPRAAARRSARSACGRRPSATRLAQALHGRRGRRAGWAKQNFPK